MHYKNKTLSDKINEFWNLDSIGICDKESSVYEKCIDKIEFSNNRYEVNLPFKNENPVLINNSNKSLLVDYDKIIKNQFNKGVIEKVTSPPLVGNTTYLLHHPVINEDKTSAKVRIVYNASTKNKCRVCHVSQFKQNFV